MKITVEVIYDNNAVLLPRNRQKIIAVRAVCCVAVSATYCVNVCAGYSSILHFSHMREHETPKKRMNANNYSK